MIYRGFVFLADDEWSSSHDDRMMLDAAKEYAAKHQDRRPLLVQVHEHAGWWLGYWFDEHHEGEIVGSANCGSQYPNHVNFIRDRISAGPIEDLPEQRRNVSKLPESLQKIMTQLHLAFGTTAVDCDYENNQATLYIRGGADADGAHRAVVVMRLQHSEAGWGYVSHAVSIPLWATLRDAGIDMSKVSHSG